MAAVALGWSGFGEPADDLLGAALAGDLASANGDPEVFGPAHAGIGAVPRRSWTGGRRRRGRSWRMRGSAGGGGVCARTKPTGEPRRIGRLEETERERTRAAVPPDPAVCAGVSRGVHPVGGGGPARRARGKHRGHAAGGGGSDGPARLRTVRRIPGTRPADALAPGGRR